jgi:2-methylcitrate dehydratase PrpD
VEVRAPVTHLANLMYEDPRSALEARFSLEYGLAVALLTGNCTLADFTDEAALRPGVRALYPRIRRVAVDKAEGEFPTQVEVSLKDGSRFETSVPMPVGSLAAPFTLDQYRAKLDGCTAGLLAPAEAAELDAALAELPQLPTIKPLMRPLGGPFAS